MDGGVAARLSALVFRAWHCIGLAKLCGSQRTQADKCLKFLMPGEGFEPPTFGVGWGASSANALPPNRTCKFPSIRLSSNP